MKQIGVPVFIAVFLAGAAAAQIDEWHHWRGPLVTGEAPAAKPPASWTQESIRWQSAIPGNGKSTPIVVGDQVIVLTAIQTDEPGPAARPAADAKTEPPSNFYEFVVMAFDRDNGEVRWEALANRIVPHEGIHRTNSYASASPITDGECIYAFFGSYGMFCFDLEGELVWSRDLGAMRTRYGWGEGASPAVIENTVVVAWDHEDQSYVFALDATNGETRWSREREEPSAWATPLIVPRGEGRQAVLSGTSARGYALADGDLLWECSGLTLNAIPTPIRYQNSLLLMSGFRGNAVLALPLNESGDLRESKKVLWERTERAPYVPSPLLYRDRLYYTSGNSAIMTVLDPASGTEVRKPQRLPHLGNLYGSPVAAAGRIYLADRDGAIVVLDAETLEVLFRDRFEDSFDASPALAGDQLFLRGQSLYCIEAPATEESGP